MFELTDAARKELDAFFKDKKKETIRIYAANGCSGPRLALALDEPNEQQDVLEEREGFAFCMDKELLAQVEGVKIDMTYMGFAVIPTVPLPVPEGGGGCAGCGGGCGGA